MADDVWSGVPDALRRLVEEYGDSRGIADHTPRTHPNWVDFLARFDAAEAALAAALRDLVQKQQLVRSVPLSADRYQPWYASSTVCKCGPRARTDTGGRCLACGRLVRPLGGPVTPDQQEEP